MNADEYDVCIRQLYKAMRRMHKAQDAATDPELKSAIALAQSYMSGACQTALNQERELFRQ